MSKQTIRSRSSSPASRVIRPFTAAVIATPQRGTVRPATRSPLEESALATGAQGGAVGLWRMARDGHSPQRCRVGTPAAGSTGTFRDTLSFGRSSLQTHGTGAGPHNVATVPLVNMSLDSAMMGGLLRTPLTTSLPASHAAPRPTTSPSQFLLPPLRLPPTAKGWITVVFDLDETLCNNRLPGAAALRPGCGDLLAALAAIRDDVGSCCFVEVVLWTASMECVARPVLDRMDPGDRIFNHLIFRDRRWYRESGYTKDLRLLGRDLSHVVIVENSPMSVALNRRHAILVKDFVGGSSFNYYYGGGGVNTRTSTGSAKDPSLAIVGRVLTSWAEAVGSHHRDAEHHALVDQPLPAQLGIVEYLRKHPDIAPTNEVVLPLPAPPAASSPQRLPSRGRVGSTPTRRTLRSTSVSALRRW